MAKEIVLRWTLAATGAMAALSQPCSVISARSQREAIQMEASSNKNGCWSRDRNGNLVFTSSKSKPNEYKPLGIPKPREQPLPARATNLDMSGKSELDITGKWILVDKRAGEPVIVYIDVHKAGGNVYRMSFQDACEGCPGGADAPDWETLQATSVTKDALKFIMNSNGQGCGQRVEMTYGKGTLDLRVTVTRPDPSDRFCESKVLEGYKAKGK